MKIPGLVTRDGKNGRDGNLRWWAALGAMLAGIAIVVLVGPQAELEIGPLTQRHNGELVAADYWSNEPLILSA